MMHTFGKSFPRGVHDVALRWKFIIYLFRSIVSMKQQNDAAEASVTFCQFELVKLSHYL